MLKRRAQQAAALGLFALILAAIIVLPQPSPWTFAIGVVLLAACITGLLWRPTRL